MSYQLTGKIKAINEVKQITDSFRVREFVVTVDGDTQYPQHIKMQVTNDRCDTLSTYAVGNDVTAHFNLRGRESVKEGVSNYWNTLDVWRIEAAAAAPAPEGGTPNETPASQTPVDTGNAQGGDDLPF